MHYRLPEKIFEELRKILHTDGGDVRLVVAWLKRARLYPDRPEQPPVKFTVISSCNISDDEEEPARGA